MKIERNKQAGFSLVEVALALGITAFCLVVLMALLPVGIATNRESFEQTTAASIANLILADLEAAPASATATSPQFQILIPASGAVTSPAQTIFFRQDESALPATTTVATASQNPTYRATLTLTAPAKTGARNATAVLIFITWPALADPTASSTPSHYSGSFETIAALDRN